MCSDIIFFLRKINPKTSIKETKKVVLKKLLGIWEKAYIETKLLCQLISELRDIVKLYTNYQRHPGRLETKFQEAMKELWDITHKRIYFVTAKISSVNVM